MPRYSGVYQSSNGTWYFKTRLRLNSTSGTQKQITRRGFSSAADASAARRQFLEHRRSRPSSSTGITVRELVERYHDEAETLGELSERTLYDQRGYRRNYIDRSIGDVPISALTTARVQHWILELRRTGGRSGDGLSPNTVRLARSLLRSAFEYAQKQGFVLSNPVTDARPPRRERSVPEFWTPDEARSFLALQEGDRLFPLWAFMLSTGVRASEFVWLTWADVDLSSGAVSLRNIPTTIGYELRSSGGKNRTAIRRIDLDDFMTAVLRQQAELQKVESQVAGYEMTPYVFTRPAGGHYHPQTISKRLARESELAGLPRLTSKGLRHTCATLMLANGVPDKVAAERLGHADTRMFQQVYSHVTKSMQDEAARRIGSALFG